MKLLAMLTFISIVQTICASQTLTRQLLSQSKQSGILTGMVVDPAESVVTRAKIIIEKKNFKLEIKTDGDGFFKVDLPEGKYRLTVRATHFLSVSRRGVYVKASRVKAINFKLIPITVSQDIGKARLTTHSTGARIEWLSASFIAIIGGCCLPRPVNSGVRFLLNGQA
jgi:flagellar basal body rod protein FlgG